MKYIVIDLEMNPISRLFKEQRKQCKNEIIEIGAVLLDDNFSEIGEFKTLIKPQFNIVIEDNIIDLTGITTQMVCQAPNFEEGLSMFFKWCESINDTIQICQWSDSDISQIMQEIRLKDYPLTKWEQELLRDWCDFQKEFGSAIGLERLVSLKQAVEYTGMKFEGRQHDALSDARNTGVLLGIIRTPDRCAEILTIVQDAFVPTSIAPALGELFDFSVFGFAG